VALLLFFSARCARFAVNNTVGRSRKKMPVFVCEGCNETLKKAQVQKHALRCRQCHAVTCVDCSHTFYGDDFEAHTTCISEAEKYEGSLYKAKKSMKTNPQDAWMDLVTEAAQNASSAPPNIRSYLSRMADFGNVPRNPKKFCNFVKNSLKLHSDATIDLIWKYLEDMRSKTISAQEASATPPTVLEPPPPPPPPPQVEVADEEENKESEKKHLKKEEKRRLKKELKRQREGEDDREVREVKRARKLLKKSLKQSDE